MINGTLRSKIDKLWEEFWTGGIANPLTVIEQISFLMFARLLDDRETRAEKRAARTSPGKDFAGNYFGPATQHLRWKNLSHEADAAKLLVTVRDELFPHLRELGEHDVPGQDESERSSFGDLMRDAQLMIQKPSLLQSAIARIDEFPLDQQDTKGDLYEYLLSKLTTAGINGQFRTPRHIIRAMVELADPKPNERICDPACGSGGFLVGALEYLYETHSSDEGTHVHEDGTKSYSGDLLAPYLDHVRSDLLTGFEFDSTMLRIAAMNTILHGVDTPSIHYQDTLSATFSERYPAEASDCFDLILANPPFKGSLDYDDVHPSLLGKVKTKKTELLFVALILRMLKLGGRAAVIVPDGVLFGSSKAHVALRKMLVDENQLEAVISLPAGVFKPYAGVSTAILYFAKGGETGDVFFYNVEADGFSLDDRRDATESNDLPELRSAWANRSSTTAIDRTSKMFSVNRDEIAGQGYALSIALYQDAEHVPEAYESPAEIISRMRRLHQDIRTGIDELASCLDA